MEVPNYQRFPIFDLKFYAKWEPITYQIRYELNGGENHESNPKTYTVNDEIDLFNPSKEGWVFDGWYDNMELKGPNLQKIEKGTLNNLTLYARWSKEAYVDYQAIWNEARQTWYIKVTVPGEDLDQDSIASIEMVRKAGELLDAPVALTPDTDKVLWFGVAGRNGYLNGNVGEYVFKVVRKDGSIYTFSFTYDKEEVKDVVGKFDAQIDYQAVYNGRKDKYQIKIYVPGEDFDNQNVQSITIIKEAGTVLAEPKPVIVTIDKVLWFEVADSEANLFAGNDGDYTYQVVRLDGSIYTFDFNYDFSKVEID
jgi:uncharacterized repeat protein (TIGR02543 family)